MANQKNFAVNPTISISRSKFIRPSQHKTSLKLGEITPIFLDEVLPGDTRKIDLGALVRMNTPVAPLMDNIFIDFFAMYCPNRLLWSHWREFMGENNTSAGIYTGTEYTIPQTNIYGGGVASGSLGDHLGLPIVAAALSKTCNVSALPARMYRLIYNEWFRDQNIIAPISVNLSDTANSYDGYEQSLLVAAKTSDYFTRALPYAQKSNPVVIPLGTKAPIVGNSQSFHNIDYGKRILFRDEAYQVVYDRALGFDANGNLASSLDEGFGGQGPKLYETNMIADLSSATAATINQLRFAFQYQKLLEKDALYGTRYWEILKSHFGIDAPDASLQRPELLGHFRMDINIDQVIQTTGANSTPTSNDLGKLAAVSVTGKKGNLVTRSFSEHGYIMILAVARHDQTYGQGIERSWSRLKRTDYYFPVFANLGAQSIKNKEIYVQGSDADDLEFGYQEAWAEYRYKPSIVTGVLRPNVTGLGYYTLANNFASLPTLGQTFIEQGRSNLARAIGSFDQDFICDFYFKDIAVRPMPLYSVPGLIDHH